MVDPTTWLAADAPDDLIAWLTGHPALTASAPEPVTNGGLTGQWVDVTSTDGSEIPIFAYPTGNVRIPPGVSARYLVLTLDGPELTVVVGAPHAGFAETTALVQPILESLVVDAGG